MNGPNPNPAKISNYMSRLLYDNDFFAEIIHFVALTTWQGVSRLPTKLPPKWAPRPFKLVHATKWLGSWKWFRTKWPCKSTLHGSGGQPFHSINFNGDVLIHIYMFSRGICDQWDRGLQPCFQGYFANDEGSMIKNEICYSNIITLRDVPNQFHVFTGSIFFVGPSLRLNGVFGIPQ
jgi:hypothetical protein